MSLGALPFSGKNPSHTPTMHTEFARKWQSRTKWARFLPMITSAPALFLAPMEGVTDAPMRAFLTELGGFTHVVSEFLRVNHEIYPKHVFIKHVPELDHGCLTSSGKPVIFQILGGDEKMMAANAEKAVALGVQAIDINFGCPSPTVNNSDGGATLLKYPARLRSIVAAVRAALPREISVSAKLRLGWDNINDIDTNFDAAVEGGADFITIHGRTRMQGYTRPAYWEPIGRMRARSPVPVVANGEIWTLDDFKRCRDITGCSHFMLGRGILADPYLARAVAHEMGLASQSSARLSEEYEAWLPHFKRFAELSLARTTKAEYTVKRIKQWGNFATKGRELKWFEKVKRLESLEEILSPLIS